MRKILFVLVLLIVAHASYAQPFWSIGPKVGYTFGKDGGFTLGWEFSYFPSQNPSRTLVAGYTVDFTSWGGHHAALHFGLEGPLIDIGPTLFFSNGVFTPGISVIPWIGILIYPYYEFAWPFGQSPFHSVGGYFKFPVGYQFQSLG